MTDWWQLAAAIVPSIALAVMFVLIVRAMITADRREREASDREGEIGHEHRSRIPMEINDRDKS